MMMTMKSKTNKQYLVFEKASGYLIGNMDWESAKSIYSQSPNDVLCVSINRKGKHQVRFICSGLQPLTRENLQELMALKAVRKANGLGSDIPR